MKNLRKIIFTIWLVLCGSIFLYAQTPSQLELNKPIEREINAGEIHNYILKAEKDKFISIIVDQKSVDVAVKFATLEIDNPNIKRGTEQIFFIAPNTENYRLEIKAKETGRYRVNLETYKSKAETDQKRIESERVFLEAEKLNASGNHAQALSKYEESFQLISGLNDKFSEAKILFNLGSLNKILGNTEKSIEYFKKSLTLFQTAGSWDEIFKDLTPLYFVMGGKDKTFTYLAEAIPLVKALKNQRLEAILLTALAKISEDLNQSSKSLDYYQEALELFRITGKRGAEVFTLTEIADGDLSLDDKKKAINYLNQAILLSQGASDKSLEGSLLTGIGYIYLSIDEHQQALNYFQKTLKIWRDQKDKNGEAYALNFIGTTYSLLGNNILAKDFLEQAIKIFQEIQDLRAEGYAILLLGLIEVQAGNSSKSLEYYQKALQIFRQTGEKRGEASSLSALAGVYWFQAERQKSLENYEKSLSIWRNLNFREGEAIALSNLGFVYNYLGQNEKSLKYHNQALPIFRLLGIQSGEISSLYGIARVLYSQGNLDESLKNTENAINLIENIRTRITSSELRTSYLATYQHIYQFYVELLMQLHKKKPANGYDALALQANERARARGLLDILSEAKADIRQGIEPALLIKERYLQKQLNLKDSERKRAKNQLQVESIDKEIRSLSADFQILQAEIKQKSPRYAELTQLQPLGIKEIQSMLDAETILLEFSLGETNSYLWIVSNNSIKTFTLPSREKIENQARAFYNAVKTPENEQIAKQAIADLSKTLISPIAAELGSKRLLIVADGALSYVPFATLTKAETPLIINHEIVYMPSASSLAALRNEANGRKSPLKTIAVLADPVFDLNDTRVNLSPKTNPNISSTLKSAQREAGFDNSQPLPRLPGTRREATTILEFVTESERKRATDFEASRATITNPEMSQFRIIHFATHGLLNSQHPELSGIVLSLVDEKGQPQDGFLRLHEIYNLSLPADLIVLSACQTALGKEIKGEGLIGLTRGFMYAGSQRVVASLWAVDDRGTSELMKNFYQNMLGEKKLRPAAALREAQITMSKSKNFSSPYFWAAFTLQGEWK